METLCRIRDIYRSIAEFESQFEQIHHLSLNEGMLLCTLSKEGQLSSGALAEALNLTPSNTSKVIRAVECKGFIERVLGDRDKRQMYFSLTVTGQRQFETMQCNTPKLPNLLNLILTKE